MFHGFIVTRLVERTNYRHDLVFGIAWHHDLILSTQDARVVVTERVALATAALNGRNAED